MIQYRKAIKRLLAYTLEGEECNEEKAPVLIPILRFLSLGYWIFCLGADFYCQETPTRLTVLHALGVLTALATAIVSFIRYRQEKGSPYERDEEDGSGQ